MSSDTMCHSWKYNSIDTRYKEKKLRYLRSTFDLPRPAPLPPPKKKVYK